MQITGHHTFKIAKYGFGLGSNVAYGGYLLRYRAKLSSLLVNSSGTKKTWLSHFIHVTGDRSGQGERDYIIRVPETGQ